MTLTMEIHRLLVCTAPVDGANNLNFEVLHVDSCSVQTIYHFQLNPFLIKSLFCFKNNIRNRYFPPNPTNKMNIHVGKQFFRIGPITITCNNQDYFKNNDYTIVQLSILILTMSQTISSYSASVYFLSTYFTSLFLEALQMRA